MRSLLDDVLSFHRKHFPELIGSTPAIPGEDAVSLRLRLIEEEFFELTDAMDHDDLPHIAKEAIDLIYVMIGMLITYGIDPVPVWRAVQASNMTKDGARREDHKLMKGPGYLPPDIAGILAAQGPLCGDVPVPSPLTPGETAALAELEHRIRSNADRADVIGVALRETRDRHLYRNTHETFAGYVRGWRWSHEVSDLVLLCAREEVGP